MFDDIQRLLYRLCGITPRDFWDYSFAECMLMVEEVQNQKKDQYEFEMTLNARLCAAIFNAQGGHNGKPVQVDEFIPKEILKHIKNSNVNPITTEDRNKKILDKGNRLAKMCK